jgi:MFS family permease
MADRHSIADFLALRRNTTLLLVALVLAGTGERLWLGFAPKYPETLGATIFIIGLFDDLQTLLGAVYAYPGGWLTDHWGQRRSLLLFNALSLAGYVLVLVWQHWLALLVGSFLFLAWSALSLPATFSVIATSLGKHQHTMGVGVQSMVRRVPMMVGPLVGGWLITRYGWEHGVQYALLGCIALSAATAVFQWFMAEPTAKTAAESKAQSISFVLATFVFFTLFPLSLLWADSFGWLAVAFAVRGLKEFGEPARKALIIAQAVPEFRARTYGAYYLIRDCVVTTGSFLGAWLWSLSPQANFIGAAVCGALGTVWFWWFVYRKRPASTSAGA